MLKSDERIKFLEKFWDDRVLDKRASDVSDNDLLEFFIDEVSK